MKIKLTALLLSFSLPLVAQISHPLGVASQNLDVTNINATILTGGDMFRELPPVPNPMGGYNPAFEVPRGSGIHSIFTAALWIGGKDQQNNERQKL